jgi:hypothetical protein
VMRSSRTTTARSDASAGVMARFSLWSSG